MAKIRYEIHIDNAVQDVFKDGTTTADREEAITMFESLKLLSAEEGATIELIVSSRGIKTVLESYVIENTGIVAETAVAPVYNYKKVNDEKSQEVFLTLLKELHEVGFSTPEIADITGRTERTVRYNLKKLEASNQIKSHGRGRPVGDAVRERIPVTMKFYKDNYEFLMERFGNVTEVVNDLVDKFREESEKSEEK